MEADLKEFRVSNDILCSPDALKSRLLEEGYLFFKGLIEPDQIGGTEVGDSRPLQAT